MTVTRATDYLRKHGMSEEQITKMPAELDQHTAESNHLIDHALSLHRGTVEHAAMEGLVIRAHVAAFDDTQLRSLFGVVLLRAGELAAAVEDLSRDKTRLEAALAAAQEATA